MLTDSQLSERRTGLGGSDAAAVLGVSPWRQPLDVYLDRVSPELVPEFSELAAERMSWGNILEEPIAAAVRRRTGMHFRKPAKSTYRDAEHPFLIAHPDRLCYSQRVGLEIKLVGPRQLPSWSHESDNEPAPWAAAQSHHYMRVLDYPRWIIAALCGGNELRLYHLERDAALEQHLIERARALWTCIENRTPPAIWPDHASTAALQRKLCVPVGPPIVLERDDAERAQRLADVRAACASTTTAAKRESARARAGLLEIMGNAESAALPDGRTITHRLRDRRSTCSQCGHVTTTQIDDLRIINAKTE